MIPKNAEIALDEIKFESYPSLTYALDPDTNQIHGKVNGLEAVRQAVYLILCTERYQYLIYSWNYGVLPEIERCIKEALLQDDRITGIDGFDFEVNRNKVRCTFTVHSIFGETQAETEVPI